MLQQGPHISMKRVRHPSPCSYPNKTGKRATSVSTTRTSNLVACVSTQVKAMCRRPRTCKTLLCRLHHTAAATAQPRSVLAIAANSNPMSHTTTTAQATSETCTALLAASFTGLLHRTQRPRQLQKLRGMWLKGEVPGRRKRAIKEADERCSLPR